MTQHVFGPAPLLLTQYIMAPYSHHLDISSVSLTGPVLLRRISRAPAWDGALPRPRLWWISNLAIHIPVIHNPMKFPKGKRLGLLLATATVAESFSSSAFLSTTVDFMKSFHVSIDVAILSVSDSVYSYAIGPFL
ncbi:hypothetical protein F4782DRAFT_503152 [Xylaria castorea]|nr:hypothetical protein F4782DRAFT_503152 [Xylaria castorea]